MTPIDPVELEKFWMAIFKPQLHIKQCRSIANGALGTMFADRLTIHGVGRGLARARELDPKHAIKQVDRLLSNKNVEMTSVFAAWVPWIVADRKELLVALDWTEYAADGHSTLACYVITAHGRATPLVWRTYRTDSFLGTRSTYEEDLMSLLEAVLPKGVRVTVLADRGFGSVALYRHLRMLGFDFVIRFRGNIKARLENGRTLEARALVRDDGAPIRYDNVGLTQAAKTKLAGIVTVHDAGMKEPWLLATSLPTDAKEIVQLYGRRFTIEEAFRDEKDPRFGMGMLETSIGATERRDRLLLLGAMARAMLTMIGAAGESLGLDRKLRANTEKRRVHSLFRQGWEYLHGAAARHVGRLQKEFTQLLFGHASEARTTAII